MGEPEKIPGLRKEAPGSESKRKLACWGGREGEEEEKEGEEKSRRRRTGGRRRGRRGYGRR